MQLVPGMREARVRSLQSHGRTLDTVAPGHRVALNLGGIEHQQVVRGDAIVVAAQWRPTQRFDATLDVLASLDHVVSRRGAYMAYIGSGEWPNMVPVSPRQKSMYS